MTTHHSLKENLAALAAGLQLAAQREQERRKLPPCVMTGVDSPLNGAGVFDESEAMRKRHQEIDKQQLKSNLVVLKNTIRF